MMMNEKFFEKNFWKKERKKWSLKFLEMFSKFVESIVLEKNKKSECSKKCESTRAI